MKCIHDSIVQSGEQVLRDGISVDGVLVVSPLADTLDLVACIPINYMHCCLEGIAKMLLQFWTDSSNHSQPYYFGQQVVEVDNELMKQHPPSEFSRPPRSIQKILKYWKVSQLRYCTLFYSLPLLLRKLPSLYWHHYSLFVCSLHILLKAKIHLLEIDAAERMLQDFYNLMREL